MTITGEVFVVDAIEAAQYSIVTIPESIPS
jgi:hypothetical protein